MKQMRRIVPLLISSFLLVVFLPFQARSASVDTPNNKNCAGQDTCNVLATTPSDKTMKVIIKSNPNLPNVDSGNVVLNPGVANGETGEELAKRIVEAICSAANATGWTIVGSKNVITPCAGGGCCDPLFSALGDNVSMVYSHPSGPGGFQVDRTGSDLGEKVKVKVVPKAGGGQLRALNSQTNGGNTVGADLLPQILIRVRTLAVSGSVSFTVFHSQGGQNPRSFSINTTGKSEDQIAAEMQSGFAALGLGLTTTVHQGREAHVFSDIFDSEGPFVRIANAQAKVDEIQVEGQAGQIPQLGMTIGVGIPALNEWGLVVVIALLLVTGYTLLRRWHLGTTA